MAKLVILGSANAVADEYHENTHMALVLESRTILIDCVGNPLARLKAARIDLHSIGDIVVTHFHPDHVSGLPSLLMSMWLLGRKSPVNLLGLEHALERVEKLMEFYDWHNWPDFYRINFQRVEMRELVILIDAPDVRMLASPVHHLIPTIGLRIEIPSGGQSLAYSCDTEPCDEVVRLAGGADILIHEATGASVGHSSAAQAGEIATRSGVKKMYLIHYPTGDEKIEDLQNQAQETFSGKVALAEDFLEIPLMGDSHLI